MMSIEHALRGAWRLMSYTEQPVDGSLAYKPYGETPAGLIVYSHDGYMSAQLASPTRMAFASGDRTLGTAEEFESEARDYIAYSGAYWVDETQAVVSHRMEVSLFPNWIGLVQRRKVRIEGDDLFLTTAEPMRSDGKNVMGYLHWHRV